MSGDYDEMIYEQMKIHNMLLCNIYVVLATQNHDKYFTGDDCYEKFLDVIRTVEDKCCDGLFDDEEDI